MEFLKCVQELKTINSKIMKNISVKFKLKNAYSIMVLNIPKILSCIYIIILYENCKFIFIN